MVVREDNRELRATVNARLLEFLNWRRKYLRNEEKTKAPFEQVHEVKSRLARIVHKIRDRTEGMMAECFILVE